MAALDIILLLRLFLWLLVLHRCRVTAWLRLSGPSGDHLLQALLQQGHPAQAAQAHGQAAFEDLPEGRLRTLSGPSITFSEQQLPCKLFMVLVKCYFI